MFCPNNNIDFLNISEKSEFLNNLGTIQKTNETNVNLLQQPSANIEVSDIVNTYILYYTVQRRQSCEKYILTGFLYDTFVPPPNPV